VIYYNCVFNFNVDENLSPIYKVKPNIYLKVKKLYYPFK